MPQPTKGDVHVNSRLTNVAIQYHQDESAFVSQKVFPVVPVQKSSDLYTTFDKGDWFRDEAKERAPATESQGGGYDVGTNTYSAQTYSFHKDVADKTVQNSDSVFTPFKTATRYTMRKILLQQEIKWASSYFTTGIWSADVTPGTLWDAANSTPVKDVKEQITAVQALTGFRPQKLVLARNVLDALETNGDIRDRIKYTSSDSITLEILARMFGVKEVMVSDAVKNSAKKGASDSMGFINSKDALLVYTTDAPSIEEPSAGYIFNWAGSIGSQGTGIRTRRFRREKLSADRVESEIDYDMKLTASDLGVFFDDVIS